MTEDIDRIMALIRTIMAIGTFVGSVIYWYSWKWRKKRLRAKLKDD